jgi:hypothetical protein
MKRYLIIGSFVLISCGTSYNVTDSDHSFIYRLPWEENKKFLLVQSYHSLFSHIDDIALDFKMKKGTKIYAARSGRIVQTKADSDRHGLSAKYLADGNHIIIEHDDGSFAWYWHLQQNGVAVKQGQYVSAGELIGYSGHTGFSAFPHLHFEVHNRNGKQVPTRFYTQNGIEYLRPGHFYKAVN